MAVETVDMRDNFYGSAHPHPPRARDPAANLDEDTTLEEIASRLWVSRNTVKSQVRSVYRRSSASSTRADAVARARQYGLR